MASGKQTRLGVGSASAVPKLGYLRRFRDMTNPKPSLPCRHERGHVATVQEPAGPFQTMTHVARMFRPIRAINGCGGVSSICWPARFTPATPARSIVQFWQERRCAPDRYSVGPVHLPFPRRPPYRVQAQVREQSLMDARNGGTCVDNREACGRRWNRHILAREERCNRGRDVNLDRKVGSEVYEALRIGIAFLVVNELIMYGHSAYPPPGRDTPLTPHPPQAFESGRVDCPGQRGRPQRLLQA